MPRSLRIEYPGAHYHTFCRGNNGQEIFLNEEGRTLFLSTLGEVCAWSGWRIHAYVLMPDHYRLLLETPKANLVAGMKWFQAAYTQRFNSMFQRRGHLFQGRYEAMPVAAGPREGGLDFFRELSTHIHLAPFRAGLFGDGLDTPPHARLWSSLPAYCGQVRKRPEWLVREKVLLAWGLKEGMSGALRAYGENLGRVVRGEADPGADIRSEFETQIRQGWCIGPEVFQKRLLGRIKGMPSTDSFRGELRRAHGESEAQRLFGEGLRLLGLKERDILDAPTTRMEKQALAWLMKTKTAAPGAWIAGRLRMGHPATSSNAIRRFARDTSREAAAIRKKLKPLTDA